MTLWILIKKIFLWFWRICLLIEMCFLLNGSKIWFSQWRSYLINGAREDSGKNIHIFCFNLFRSLYACVSMAFLESSSNPLPLGKHCPSDLLVIIKYSMSNTTMQATDFPVYKLKHRVCILWLVIAVFPCFSCHSLHI